MRIITFILIIILFNFPVLSVSADINNSAVGEIKYVEAAQAVEKFRKSYSVYNNICRQLQDKVNDGTITSGRYAILRTYYLAEFLLCYNDYINKVEKISEYSADCVQIAIDSIKQTAVSIDNNINQLQRQQYNALKELNTKVLPGILVNNEADKYYLKHRDDSDKRLLAKVLISTEEKCDALQEKCAKNRAVSEKLKNLVSKKHDNLIILKAETLKAKLAMYDYSKAIKEWVKSVMLRKSINF